MQTPNRRVRALIAALLALAIGGGTLALTTTDDNPSSPATPSVTVHVDGLDAGKTPDRTITVPKAAIAAAAPQLEDDLQTERPAGITPQQQAAIEEQTGNVAATQPALPTAGATAGFTGCRTSFVRNQSSRGGVRPQVQTLHYTVSPNRAGWADVDAVVALFNRTSSQASSHFVIDSEGHCAYIVPIEAKAWTQAAGNPTSVSYEIIATGREATYLAPAGLAKLRAVTREVSRRTGIPMRAGRITGNCTVAKTGIVQHKDWGICGGGHVDITPFSLTSVTTQLIGGQVTATDRVTCRRLNWWRNNGRPQGAAQRNASRRKAALTKRHVTCTPHGPVTT